MSMTDKFDGLVKEWNDTLDAFRVRAQLVFTDVVTEVFESDESIRYIEWVQYTPFFNDGDACTFSVHEIDICADGVDEDTYEASRFQWGDRSARLKSDPRWSKIKGIKDSLYDLLCSDLGQSLMKNIYGDHVHVRINRDKTVTVTEYDHD